MFSFKTLLKASCFVKTNLTTSNYRASSTLANLNRSLKMVRIDPDLKESLQMFTDSPLPVIHDANDLLIRVYASSINPLDIAMSRGYGRVALTLANIIADTGIDRLTYDRLPLTLGRDFVGEVVDFGSNVNKFKHGAVVWGTVPPYYGGGSHGDYVVTNQSCVWFSPKNISPIEATSIPYVGTTAWSALTTFACLNPRDYLRKRVLVLGAGGGVGSIAIQLLSNWEADITVTCSKTLIPWLQSLSEIKEAIDYEYFSDYLTQQMKRFDLILDASSPQASFENYKLLRNYLKQSLFPVRYLTLTSPLLRNMDQNGLVGGTIKTVADVAADTVDGISHGLAVHWAYYLPKQQSILNALTTMVENGTMKPINAKSFNFDHIVEAYQWLDETRSVNGKAVIENKSMN